MIYLAVVSLIWAFSFGLIKQRLGGVDPSLAAAVRLLLASLLFLPFLRVRRIPLRLTGELLVIGTVQFGLMYLLYMAAFRFLKAHEVALFTVFTPFFVTLINDWDERRLHRRALLAVAIAVLGAGILVYRGLHWESLLRGALLVQASNFCFAFGQIRYRKVMATVPHLRDHEGFAYLYLGAAAVTTLVAAWSVDLSTVTLTPEQGLALLYLGLLASGVCFFLWNLGARRTRPGTLAVFNNAKIPLAVACSLLFFGEHANLLRLLAGGGLMLAALILNETGAEEDTRNDPQAGALPEST